MTKEQLQAEVDRLMKEVNRQTEKINQMENVGFYLGRAEQCNVYERIAESLRDLIDRGGFVIISGNERINLGGGIYFPNDKE